MQQVGIAASLLATSFAFTAFASGVFWAEAFEQQLRFSEQQ